MFGALIKQTETGRSGFGARLCARACVRVCRALSRLSHSSSKLVSGPFSTEELSLCLSFLKHLCSPFVASSETLLAETGQHRRSSHHTSSWAVLK
ncbi:hypothetical protein SKAU_G00065990 [Synaphobranchus kaupii]|uniref:Uncharacterized protein n=1 Tax=Synaphobranchus kaupii TaxID=118154 RepID=A0A9Q1J920_SYNKA|nr:hypothetical protein SKAU_G00065990 [Synaphobranchus kaupii]